MKAEHQTLKCQNSNCGRMTDELLVAQVDGKSYDLCPQCSNYARKKGVFRTAEMETARAAMEKERKAGNTKRCNNPNCQTIYLDRGSYGKNDGKYYCNACFLYSKRHNGACRSKEMVAAYRAAESHPKVDGKEKCQCGRMVERLVLTALDDGTFMHLCHPCYYHMHRKKKLRTREMELARVERAKKKAAKVRPLKKKREREEEGTGDAADPIVLSDSSDNEPQDDEKWQKCSNPNCGKMVQYLFGAKINGKGTLHMCHACYCYGCAHHTLRPKKVIKVTADTRKRQKGLQRCHNPNCRTKDLNRGLYAKHNNEFYCFSCGVYAGKHEGRDRPKKLVERARLHRSRYLWTLNHPRKSQP